MKTSMVLIAPVILFATSAAAQSPERSPAPTHRIEQSPGTTGAMNSTSSGIATSADDVKNQQDGGHLAADGGGMIDGQRTMERQSPGTVGSSPGFTAPNGR